MHPVGIDVASAESMVRAAGAGGLPWPARSNLALGFACWRVGSNGERVLAEVDARAAAAVCGSVEA